jgi:hypothetical protein
MTRIGSMHTHIQLGQPFKRPAPHKQNGAQKTARRRLSRYSLNHQGVAAITSATAAVNFFA